MKLQKNLNYIFCGDNIDWLNQLPDESVDLVYIDPPFFSNRNYEVIWGNGFETRSFGDRFAGGISHYIDWMEERLTLVHRKIKKDGSMFLHCDANASHRLRMLMDKIFGENQFKNFITWKRSDTHNDAKGQFPSVCDHILYYSKSKDCLFNPQYADYAENTLKEWYLFLDLPDGTTRKMTKEEIHTQKIPKGSRRFNTGDLSSPNPRPNLMFNYKGYPHPKNGWRKSLEEMKKFDKAGLLLFPKAKDGRIMVKRYLDEQKGPVLGDLWTDIDLLRGNNGEHMGYKTQKPEALVRRIIECASKEGDVILDCFGGGGTTAKVCADLGRTFITGDVSPVSIKIMAERLLFDCPNTKFEILNLPKSEKELKTMNGHLFAEFVCEVSGWKVNDRKSGDGGIDGWAGDNSPVQIKNHSNASAGRPDIQKFVGALMKEKKKKGYFVAWGFSKDAREYIADIKQEHKIEIVPMECSEVFGGLLLDNSKSAEIEKLYLERRPKNWASNVAKAAAHKTNLDKIAKAKSKTVKRKKTDAEAG